MKKKSKRKLIIVIALSFFVVAGCARYRFNKEKVPRNGNAFVVSNISIADSLFPGKINENCNDFKSMPNSLNANILELASEGNEKYIVIFRNKVFPADEYLPCCYQNYILINIINEKPNLKKSIISWETCEIPNPTWIPYDIKIFRDSAYIKANEYNSDCNKNDTLFKYYLAIDSTFSYMKYLENIRKCKELEK